MIEYDSNKNVSPSISTPMSHCSLSSLRLNRSHKLIDSWAKETCTTKHLALNSTNLALKRQKTHSNWHLL